MSESEKRKRVLGTSEGLAAATMAEVDRELEALGFYVTSKSRRGIADKLAGYDAKAAARAIREAGSKSPPQVQWPHVGDLSLVASVLEHREATGDYGEPEVFAKRPSLSVAGDASQSSPRAKVSFKSLLILWQTFGRANREPAPASIIKYTRRLEHLAKFLGHSDAARVSVDDAYRYSMQLKATKHKDKPPSHKQLRDAMAICFTVFAKGVKARKLADNVFFGLVPSKPSRGEQTKRRGFTDTEASTILRAARGESDTFRRWGPWLMAYSGMRVTEAAQLRVMDVEILGDGGAIIHVREEAGAVKSGVNRIVPAHRALVSEGFLEFVQSVKGVWLFPHVALDKKGNRKNAAGRANSSRAHKLAGWVRSLGITDPKVPPDHGWRHRFEVVAVKARMQQKAIDRMMGHTSSRMSDNYLNDDLRELLLEEMPRFPTIAVDDT